MHYYKRDLSPILENFTQCSEKLIYKQNFQDYEGSLISKGFKDELLTNLGNGVRCVSTSIKNRTMQTYIIETDEPKH